MYYVYVLKGSGDKLYKGYCSDLRKRFEQHNSGKIKSTKSLRPLKLIYYEAFESKNLARKEELFLKSGKGRERLKLIFK
jgi:putative endonuclease